VQRWASGTVIPFVKTANYTIPTQSKT